ncbi:hypothetical protein sos41_02580 [Alphaproteobacteria bacterium SO-S41]|nr:hypothetical protein sos41_02580 [Alphaproteobacteria bacterium SO-S41]
MTAERGTELWTAAAASPIALLASVPYEHLVSAVEDCPADSEAAFGTNAVDALVNLTGRLKDGVCPVLIYASMAPEPGAPRVTWRGVFTSHVGGRAGLYRGTACRPPSTATDGKWDTFWTMRHLARLAPGQARLVASLKGWQKKSFYAPDFVPHGPVLIHNPGPI